MGQLVSDVNEVLDYKKSKKEAASTRQQILSQMAADEKNKTNLIKKALATQRAKYGAAGMTNQGMTEQAVLARLESETAEPFAGRRQSSLEKLKKTRATKPNLLKTILSRFDNLMG